MIIDRPFNESRITVHASLGTLYYPPLSRQFRNFRAVYHFRVARILTVRLTTFGLSAFALPLSPTSVMNVLEAQSNVFIAIYFQSFKYQAVLIDADSIIAENTRENRKHLSLRPADFLNVVETYFSHFLFAIYLSIVKPDRSDTCGKLR